MGPKIETIQLEEADFSLDRTLFSNKYNSLALLVELRLSGSSAKGGVDPLSPFGFAYTHHQQPEFSQHKMKSM